MESITCRLDGDSFDKAVHGGLDANPVLPEGCDLAVYVKPGATEQGKSAVVVTFTVQLPDGSLVRAQCATTLVLFESVFACIRGWKAGGLL